MKKWFDAYTFSEMERDEKGTFGNAFAHLISAHYSRERTPDWFLNRVSNLFGLNCDIEIFYEAYFSSLERKIAFVNLIIHDYNYIPVGEWADVERTLRAWLSEENIIQKLQALERATT